MYIRVYSRSFPTLVESTMVIFLRPARRSKAIFISAFVFLCLIYTLFSGFSGFAGLSAAGRPYDTWVADGFSRATSNTSDAINCNAFSLPGASEVQVVLKTGAAEAFDKLLVHLSTVTSCINPSDILIFSDLEEDVGQWHLYDALSRLPTSYRSSNADFAVYEAQQTYRQAKVSLKSLQGGWALDKYKFLPMMDMAFQLRPEKKWFLFIEADTFVVWDNFFYWISHLNPDEPLYLGSPVWPKGKTVFAHGGSGLVLSHAALRVLTKDAVGTSTSKPGSHQHGVDMTKQCCGDEVLAQVLKNKGISIHGYWPMFNGEKPSTVKFGKEHWCEPVITLHHLSPEDTSEFWRWLPTRAAGTAVSLTRYNLMTILNSGKIGSSVVPGHVPVYCGAPRTPP